jgi:hypothetical protein
MEPSNSSAFFTAFAMLDAQIQHLQTCLPPIAFIPNIRNSDHVRKLVVCHSIIYVSLIELHAISAERSDYSKRKRLDASRGVFEGILMLVHGNFQYLNPTIAVTSNYSHFSSCSSLFFLLPKYIWLEAAQIMINEVKSSRSHAQCGDSSERSMSNLVERVLTTIQPFANHGSFMSR